MEYIYKTIYRFEGIAGTNLDEDKIVFNDEANGTTVFFSNEIDRHCHDLDTGLACAGLLLTGKFSDETMPMLISAEISKIQKERNLKKKIGVYAVIIIKGNVELHIDEDLHRKTEQLSICFDTVDKEGLLGQHKEKINSIVSSLSIATSPEYLAEKISSGIYFIDDDNKPLYSFTLKGGDARLILSKPIDDEKRDEINKLIGLSINNQQLSSPFRLLSQSLQTKQDKMRSFISSWSSLEIFTNKVFSIYEQKFIDSISDDHNSHGVNRFLDRITDVMKDKYRLTDKFTLIASFLSDNIEKDIVLFKKLKKLRDNIFHGKEFNEEALPVEEARKLTAQYLKAHMILMLSA